MGHHPVVTRAYPIMWIWHDRFMIICYSYVLASCLDLGHSANSAVSHALVTDHGSAFSTCKHAYRPYSTISSCVHVQYLYNKHIINTCIIFLCIHNVGETIINQSFRSDLYDLFMVIWRKVYCCFTMFYPYYTFYLCVCVGGNYE